MPESSISRSAARGIDRHERVDVALSQVEQSGRLPPLRFLPRTCILDENPESKALTTPVPEVCPVAIADPSAHIEAPTQETGTLPRIPERERQRAFTDMPRLAPGRYLAVEDGADVVLLR